MALSQMCLRGQEREECCVPGNRFLSLGNIPMDILMVSVQEQSTLSGEGTRRK